MNKEQPANWLLLRGLSREAGHWGEFVEQLQTALPNAHIHKVDLPGTGRYYQQQSPCTIGEISRFVRLRAQEQGLLQTPINLLALSLGGMVAWDWLSHYPDDINAAILVNTSFASLSPFHQRLRWQSYRQISQVLLETDSDRRELAILNLVSNRNQQNSLVAAEWQNIQRLRPVSPSNSFRQILAAARFKPTNQHPRPPVLLLNSAQDRLVSPHCSLAIQQQWQLPMYIHPWAGHDLSMDDGPWLIEQIKTWLKVLTH